ncbi:hypothetical protein V1264_008942 [Littorina saxatilis]
MANYPAHEEFFQLASKLDGEFIHPMNPEEYANVTATWNIRVTGLPFAHIMAQSVEDVQQTIAFAKKYNIMVAVRSSGHSFIGRSTHDGALIINLFRMKGKKFNLDSVRNMAGEVTLESGNSWLEVYEAVDKQVTYDTVGNVQRRVIVGGSAHTVAMGGYTQGGGHSPYSRQIGLAADSLLEATIVLADGRKAVVNEQGTTITTLDGASSTSNDNSLFWAIRGGGGGTWGVVTDFTFRLHYAPERFRHVIVNWALTYKGTAIGSDDVRFILKQLTTLSSQWGGYFLVSGAQLTADAKGAVTLSLIHFGSDQDASNHEVDALLGHNPRVNQFGLTDTNYTTFLEYEATPKDGPSGNAYIYNTFVQSDIGQNTTKLDQLVDFLLDSVNPPTDESALYCTGVLIGGKTNEIAEGATPVNPKFRSGLMSMTCSLSWTPNNGQDSLYINHALLLRDGLSKLGEGSYFNEPAEDLDDWKQQFWGNSSTYDRLLQIKRQWDPDHFFWCHNCVGSDDVTSG